MAESTLGRWWFSPPEPQAQRPEAEPAAPPEPQPATHFWSWSSPNPPASESRAPPQPPAPTTSWWPSFTQVGTAPEPGDASRDSRATHSDRASKELQAAKDDAATSKDKAPDTRPAKEHNGHAAPPPGGVQSARCASEPPASAEEPAANSWFGWSFFSAPASDADSGIHDKSDLEAFREAKAAIESFRDTCHYVIAGKPGSHSVQLAVSGTRTERRPVSYNHRKKVCVPNEFYESSLASKPPGAEAGVHASDAETPSEPPRPDADASRSPASPSGCAVLPQLDDAFREITLQTRLRLHGESFLYGDQTSEKHLYRSTKAAVARKRRRTRRAVVIAVHSFLPAKFVKSAIGQATGSALSFSKLASEAVREWAGAGVDITTLSLEGVGRIDARVEQSYALLQNWRAEVGGADFVFVVANSVASPAALALLHRIIYGNDFDVSRAKVGLLSMAGALQGSFKGLDTRVVRRAYSQCEYDILSEVFELGKARSPLSAAVCANIAGLCAANVKMTFAAALGDQFVPVPSAAGQCVRHANVYKCVYTDEEAGFVARLFGAVLTMENVGFSDHCMVAGLGDYVQGPVSPNGAHGRIVAASAAYAAGVRFAMDTTSLTHGRAAAVRAPGGERSPFDLPWCLRGLVHDMLRVKHIGSHELMRGLVREYRAWEPATRQTRELKVCFAAFDEVTPDDVIL